LETLKLLHGAGSLPSPRVTSVSCSGGEASLMADLAEGTQLEFADFSKTQLSTLGAVLGERVGLANPLDYHTYIWSDVPTMTACFTAVMSGDASLNVFVLDIPRDDICDPAGHDCAIEAIIQAKQASGAQVAVIATLPENMNEEVTQRFLSAGVIPLHGMQAGIAAIDAAIRAGRLQQQPEPVPVIQASSPAVSGFVDLDEQQAKSALAKFGLSTPRSISTTTKDEAMSLVSTDDYPLVLKGLGIAHKSEAGAVILSIQDSAQLAAAFDKMPAQASGFLLESMIAQGGAELIIGVSRDQLGLFVLTIGAGGILTELLTDTASLLLPARRSEIQEAIESLKINRILQGFRGQPTLDLQAVLDAIEAVMKYVNANQQHLQELDINPLIVQSDRAIAVDALIRLSK
jgi:acyl-CoA synthetase (NDP forming)